ncbi:swi5-dependent recombination DNA repair protein 1 homolog [Patiria miniata]|uniref:Swi5-dependent recombination DNA repair protein 1 homolog n=1 Tax=Patiria miniata TaxID=46514 RepID=A0A913Z305_PATMI|nr:swi5-dependent recombination DNA repair protein 1 homolog [Patiria miniata]XP_038046197.1 swi5-dependent recombination DNA repair protein 1 homolog [Patiria miniata]XP_038046198.1 swi5-dependent recombination DNA repair protein 1 homolog [Patiria miniata]XP_038046199.1 swi5-dependent recombination DNA repair protein 1 homolog [Patiria miniata]
MDIAALKLRREELLRQVAADMERLRKLKMVKMYRTKNDLSELQDLIDKWRTACQTALEELHHMTSEPRPPMGKLISDWKVNPELVQFDVETDSFL